MALQKAQRPKYIAGRLGGYSSRSAGGWTVRGKWNRLELPRHRVPIRQTKTELPGEVGMDGTAYPQLETS